MQMCVGVMAQSRRYSIRKESYVQWCNVFMQRHPTSAANYKWKITLRLNKKVHLNWNQFVYDSFVIRFQQFLILFNMKVQTLNQHEVQKFYETFCSKFQSRHIYSNIDEVPSNFRATGVHCTYSTPSDWMDRHCKRRILILVLHLSFNTDYF